ncbi:MAG: hypothetical protein MK066_10175 [Crocinitomicaceae bacterium]|nr:hypothetical protein [Crocinitomicaceae bacterium]
MKKVEWNNLTTFVENLQMKSGFLRRLKYYGIGFGLGIVFVFFFFQNRGCSWLPGNRVKNSVLDRLIVVSEKTSIAMQEKGIDEKVLIEVLNDGDVIFGESDKNADSKVYKLEKDGVNYCFTLPYESFISELFLTDDAFSVKRTTDGIGEIVHFPVDSTLVYVDSTKMLRCQQDELELGNPVELFKLIKESGKIDFSKSNFEVRPKPQHYIFFEKENDTIGTEMIWYKNKLNITSFYVPFTTECK